MEKLDHGVGALQVTKNDVQIDYLDLFVPPDVDNTIERSHETVVKPSQVLNDDGPWDFQFETQGEHYMKLDSARMYIKGKVTKADGTDLVTTDSNQALNDEVALTNLPISSFFRDVEVIIEGKVITSLSVTDFGYINYLQHILSYSKQSQETHLEASGFVMDKEGKFDSITGADNTGFVARKQDANGFELYGPVGIDFMTSGKVFPPGFSFSLRFNRQNDAFCLMGAPAKNYKVHFEKVEIHIRHLEAKDSVREKHINSFKNQSKSILLPMNKTEIKVFAFPANVNTMAQENAFRSTIPKSIIIGIVDQVAYTGQYDKNPYNFQHCNVIEACLKVNGKQVPTTPYRPSFPKHAMREYKSIFDNTGIKNLDYANMITYKLFKEGVTLFTFDLTPDNCCGDHCHEKKTGTISIDFRCNSVLNTAKHMIVQAVYDSCIVIDPNHVISVVY